MDSTPWGCLVSPRSRGMWHRPRGAARRARAPLRRRRHPAPCAVQSRRVAAAKRSLRHRRRRLHPRRTTVGATGLARSTPRSGPATQQSRRPAHRKALQRRLSRHPHRRPRRDPPCPRVECAGPARCRVLLDRARPAQEQVWCDTACAARVEARPVGHEMSEDTPWFCETLGGARSSAPDRPATSHRAFRPSPTP